MLSLVTISKANAVAVAAAIVAVAAAADEVVRGGPLTLPVVAMGKHQQHLGLMIVPRQKADFSPTRQPMAHRSLGTNL